MLKEYRKVFGEINDVNEHFKVKDMIFDIEFDKED